MICCGSRRSLDCWVAEREPYGSRAESISRAERAAPGTRKKRPLRPISVCQQYRCAAGSFGEKPGSVRMSILALSGVSVGS